MLQQGDPFEYQDADDAFAAASKLDQRGEWHAAISIYESLAEKWPEHAGYASNCINGIRQRQDNCPSDPEGPPPTKIPVPNAPVVARGYKRLALVSFFVAVVGTAGWIFIVRKCNEIDKDYKLHRRSQFSSHVSGSRSLHPWNTYLPWGPQVVTSGYSGPDEKESFELQKEPYLVFLRPAKVACFGGFVAAILFYLMRRNVIARGGVPIEPSLVLRPE